MHEDESLWGAPVRRAEDVAVARELLAAVPEIERGALARYYGGLQSTTEIESSLQWAPGRFAEIRMELRKQFFAKFAPGQRRLRVGWTQGRA